MVVACPLLLAFASARYVQINVAKKVVFFFFSLYIFLCPFIYVYIGWWKVYYDSVEIPFFFIALLEGKQVRKRRTLRRRRTTSFVIEIILDFHLAHSTSTRQISRTMYGTHQLGCYSLTVTSPSFSLITFYFLSLRELQFTYNKENSWKFCMKL